MATDIDASKKINETVESGQIQITNEKLPYYIDIWKKTIDVQSHFNDLELRIRNFAITLLVALLTGAGLTLKDNISVVIFGYSLPVAVLLIFTALVAWVSFYLMDAFWYHRLLLGAVEHGKKIEQQLKELIPFIDLTTTIGNEINGAGLSPDTSNRRMNRFYWSIAIVLILLSVLLVFRKAGVETANTNQTTNANSSNTQDK